MKSNKDPIDKAEYHKLLDLANREADAGLYNNSYQTLMQLIARVQLRNLGLSVSALKDE